MTHEFNVLSFAVEEVKYDVGLLTLKMEGYDKHKLFVNSQLKSLDKSIKNVPKPQLGDNTEQQAELDGLKQALDDVQHDVWAKVDGIGKELLMLHDKTQLVTEAAQANSENITSICEIGGEQIGVYF